MPEISITLTVFVSFTADLSPVYASLVGVVDELNSTHQADVRFRVTSVANATPGVDPDSNRHLQQADIYVGMMRSKFSDPLKHTSFATEQAFTAALERFDKDPSNIRLLFYFFPVGSLSSIDIDELMKVKHFQSSLGKRVLWSEIAHDDSFSSTFKNHLAALVKNEWDSQNHKWRSPESPPKKEDVEVLPAGVIISLEDGPLDNDEKGYLGLLAEATDQLQSATSILNDVAESTNSLGDMVKRATTRLGTPNLSMADQIRIIDDVAKHMLESATVTWNAAGGLRVVYQRAFENLVSAVAMAHENPLTAEDQESLRTLLDVVTQGVDQQAIVIEQVRQYRNIINSMPRPTGKFATAKKKLTGALDEMIGVLVVIGEQGNAAASQLLSEMSHA